MAFELEDFTPAKLASINVRSEKHGPDHLEPAVDLAFQLDASNTILNHFDGHLLSSLYHRSEAAGDGKQQSLDGVEEVASLPNLRFPSMGPIKWGKELAGYTLTIDHGLGGASEIQLVDCKVNEFKIEPKEGGTVQIRFRIQCATHLTERTMGKLALLAQNEVPIMLTAPETDGQQDVENPFPVPERDPEPENPFELATEQTPESAFTAAVQGQPVLQ